MDFPILSSLILLPVLGALPDAMIVIASVTSAGSAGKALAKETLKLEKELQEKENDYSL